MFARFVIFVSVLKDQLISVFIVTQCRCKYVRNNNFIINFKMAAVPVKTSIGCMEFGRQCSPDQVCINKQSG